MLLDVCVSALHSQAETYINNGYKVWVKGDDSEWLICMKITDLFKEISS